MSKTAPVRLCRWSPNAGSYEGGIGGDHADRNHKIRIDTKHNEKAVPELAG